MRYMSRTTSYLLRPLVLLMLAALVVSAVAVVLASPAQAATYTVNSTADTVSGDGSCGATAPDDCTLRDAIDLANASTSVEDTINFNLVSPATITLGSQLPTITDSAGLIIDGGSAKITVSGNNAVRVFEVGTSTISGAKLTLNNLTVANGRATNGGGILNNSSNTLVVNNSTISGNIAYVTVGLTGIGGGIHNSGALTVSNSTISDNNASNAGGIWNNPSSTLTVSNSTVSGNKANFVGGIYNSQGTLTVSNSTISNNTGFLDGVGIYGTTRSTTTLKNTIVANNLVGADNLPSGEDCSGIMTDGGYNLDSGTSCGFSATNNSLSSTDPMLGPLADNGGPTKTHALLEGSPAIDKGNRFGATTDQRGLPRPSNFVGIVNAADGSDIGAFELQAPDTTPPKVLNSTSPVNNATQIAPGVNVTATFSEAMDASPTATDGDPSTITGTTFKLMKAGTTTAIGAVVSYNATSNKAKLDPNANLQLGTKYKAVVTTGAQDVAGNQLDQDQDPSNGLKQKAWTFTIRN
jgi:CSLREA domain-containing protein